MGILGNSSPSGMNHRYTILAPLQLSAHQGNDMRSTPPCNVLAHPNETSERHLEWDLDRIRVILIDTSRK